MSHTHHPESASSPTRSAADADRAEACRDPSKRFSSCAPWLIGPAFVLLGAFMLLGTGDLELPVDHTPPVSFADLSDEPLRRAPRHPPTIARGGEELPCMECHARFISPARTPATLTEHQNIVLNHGINDRCFNCHDRMRRDMLVLPGGDLLRFDQAPRLCATCHGPTYRDWELGIHGRTTGSWDTASGNQRRLACVQCHDPHAPAFPQMSLLPGPHTIRMGAHQAGDADHAQDESRHEYGKRNPLRQWMDHLRHSQVEPDDEPRGETEPEDVAPRHEEPR